MKDTLTTDQINLESFFGAMLEDFKVGTLTKDQAIGGLVAFAVALNKGDFEGARRWANEGRKLARDLISLDDASMLLAPPPNQLAH